MKRLLFLFLILVGLSQNISAQGFGLNSLYTTTPTLMNCDPLLTIDVFPVNVGNSFADYILTLGGSNYTPSTLTATINWGDGTSSQHTGFAGNIGSAMTWTPSLQHFYSSPGSYPVFITITNPQNGSSVSTQMYFMLSVCPGTISSIVNLDCNSDGVYESTTLSNVPLIFTGSNNFNTQVNTTNGFAIGSTNAPAGTYNVTVDQTWLSNNNYVISNASDLQMTINSTTNSDTAVIILNCAGSTSNLCLNGYAYCDANFNNIFDQGETVFANVPLTINNNGVNYQVYTNNNGYYTLNYAGTVGSPTIIQVNGLWMSQNNCTTQSMVSTVLATNCASPTTFNVPFICTSCSTTSMCAAVQVFCDANGNGMMDNGEVPLINAPVAIYSNSGQNPTTIYTNTAGFAILCGNYYTTTGSYAVINPLWLQQNGYTVTASTIPLYPNTLPTPNAALIPVNCSGTNNACDDLWTTVTPWIGYYQNTTATIRLNIGNYGPGTATTYTVTLSYPVGVSPVLSSISIPGYTISGNTISWNLTNAAPGYSFTDFIQFTIPSGIMNTTQHFYTSNISATGSNTDCNYQNNDGSLLQIVGNSYDPNDKNVNLPEELSSVVTDHLTYTIRFQNTGTAPAQNIHILDTLSANLDWTTFDLIYTSHNMHTVDLGNGIRRFEFPEIWLPDSTTNEPLSHGMIVYRIKESSTNITGDEIFNTAYIYFDWNPAIVTNTTYNVNGALGLDELNNLISVYPNPASTYFTVQSETEMEWITLTDMSGKQIQHTTADGTSQTVGVENLEKGIYILSVKTSMGIRSSKLLVH
jgi:uncharacterized repeat protein (TIGR01451 family)